MSNLISVTQFNNYVHNIFLAEEILQNITLYGEVSGLSFSGDNLYFSIKDEGAVLSCVKFGYRGDYIPKEGEMITVFGSPNYYIKGGRFSFNVLKIQPYGQGALYKQFLELKQKLEALGMFDATKKKPIPAYIKRVGVVSSETGAVIQDIIDITGRRNPMLDIVLYPAKVQGIGAEQTIIDGIKALDKTDVDVIIIARGGGSAEDLSTFNDEKLAFAIFEANKPIISAVGHETDFTIADFVASLRAPTPSAAAEIVAVDVGKLKSTLENSTKRLITSVDTYYRTKDSKLDNLVLRQNYSVDLVISDYDKNLKNNILKLSNCSNEIVSNFCHNFELKVNKLESLNPIRLLKIGYSQVLNNGKVVKSVNNVNVDDEVTINLADGILGCSVKYKEEVKK